MPEQDQAFLYIQRKNPEYRPVAERIVDWDELHKPCSCEMVAEQALRCMDCGTPFCHGYGCPLGNLIPEWNGYAALGKWKAAFQRLILTSPFPEFTGRLCPALCESACTLGLDFEPVAVRQTELMIIEKAFASGWVVPRPPSRRSGRKVAVIGSGPAGLAAADRLNKLGHNVTIFEKALRPGGILRYGIPDFKLAKRVVERRIKILAAEGIAFSCDLEVGVDVSLRYLLKKYDALVVASGCQTPRDIRVPGREAKGIYFALDYLKQQNLVNEGVRIPPEERIMAQGRKVVVIGGGDTGSDCIQTAVRQGALEIVQIEILPKPPVARSPAEPWPMHPRIFRKSAVHEEGGVQRWAIITSEFVHENGRIVGLNCAEAGNADPGIAGKQGADFHIEADFAILAAGFVAPAAGNFFDHLGLQKDERGLMKTDENSMTTHEGVFAAGDAATGPSLVVRAVAGGKAAAEGVNRFLLSHN